MKPNGHLQWNGELMRCKIAASKQMLALATMSVALGCSGESDVTASKQPDLQVSPSELGLTVGESQQLVFIASKESGVDGAQVTWESNDAGVASVSNSGLVVGMGRGLAEVRASVGAQSAKAMVTVTGGSQLSAATLSIMPESVTLSVGQTVQFTATLLDEAGDTVEIGSLAWGSPDSNVVMIDGNGVATGLAAGESLIFAVVTPRVGGGVDSTMTGSMDLRGWLGLRSFGATTTDSMGGGGGGGDTTTMGDTSTTGGTGGDTTFTQLPQVFMDSARVVVRQQ